MDQPLFFFVALLVMVGGLIGILLPIIPSIPMIWLGVFIYGLATSFARVTPDFFLVISTIALAMFFLDYTLSMWGLKNFKASVWGVVGAVIGGLIGSLFGLVQALVVGPIVGATTAEILRGRDAVFSYATRRYTVIGFVGGTILKLVAGLAMIGLFLYQVFGRGI